MINTVQPTTNTTGWASSHPSGVPDISHCFAVSQLLARLIPTPATTTAHRIDCPRHQRTHTLFRQDRLDTKDIKHASIISTISISGDYSRCISLWVF